MKVGQATSNYDLDAVKKNAKGGVFVSEEARPVQQDACLLPLSCGIRSQELKAAFEFFDVDNSGKITIGNLRKRLGVFYKVTEPERVVTCMVHSYSPRPTKRAEHAGQGISVFDEQQE